MANSSNSRKHNYVIIAIIASNIIILLGCTLLLIASFKSHTKENKLHESRTYEIKKQTHKIKEIEIYEEIFKQELSTIFCDLKCIRNYKKEVHK